VPGRRLSWLPARTKVSLCGRGRLKEGSFGRLIMHAAERFRLASAACPQPGAIARTATNIRSGAQSPVAGMAHAATLFCVLLFAAPLASYIPMAALAGILMIVAYKMGEWSEIPQLLRLMKTDIRLRTCTSCHRL
jgi:Sulfate permease family